MATSLKAYLRTQIELGLRRFLDDLHAIDAEHLGSSPGGIARSPYDLAFELAEGNREFTRRLKGEPATPSAGFVFLPAPKEWCDLDRISTQLELETNLFLKELETMPEEAMELPIGDGKATPLGIATVVNRHLHYHDAQLNYIQTLLGDAEVHWR